MPKEKMAVVLFSVLFLVIGSWGLSYVWPPGWGAGDIIGDLIGDKILDSMTLEDVERFEQFSEIALIILGMFVSGIGLIVTILVSLGKSKRERERHKLEIRKLRLQIEQLQSSQ
ncbi:MULTISPECIES: LapA family protein [unclassified Ruegeria]|uniref:LapA family protein n=1 Tax=unclassified Ruegeria TaxID=2625375 RepID=UPI001490ED7A|nr:MULTISPECIES: LapA family protein [unclassified Ruegeria]NOD88370.1 DUF1049 domain-containing protein [Ruegeria sp. HKCCD4318]NOE13279.1 DUF1049 domain-containing protein [Ruegeria sp. HKCCD4318-2]NOG11179.1 LapA family protein [Ruegeria sp. HKCCD4315]